MLSQHILFWSVCYISSLFEREKNLSASCFWEIDSHCLHSYTQEQLEHSAEYSHFVLHKRKQITQGAK